MAEDDPVLKQIANIVDGKQRGIGEVIEYLDKFLWNNGRKTFTSSDVDMAKGILGFPEWQRITRKDLLATGRVELVAEPVGGQKAVFRVLREALGEHNQQVKAEEAAIAAEAIQKAVAEPGAEPPPPEPAPEPVGVSLSEYVNSKEAGKAIQKYKGQLVAEMEKIEARLKELDEVVARLEDKSEAMQKTIELCDQVLRDDFGVDEEIKDAP
jgi:hypothetical protein